MVKYVNPDNPVAGVLIEDRTDPTTGIVVTVTPGTDHDFKQPQLAPDQKEQSKDAPVAASLTPQDIKNAEIQQMQADLDQAKAEVAGIQSRVEGKQFDQQRRLAQSDAASDTPSSPFTSGPVETTADASGKLATEQRGGQAVEATTDPVPTRSQRGMLTVDNSGPLLNSPVFGDQDREDDDDHFALTHGVIHDESPDSEFGLGFVETGGDGDTSTTTTTAAPEENNGKGTKESGGGGKSNADAEDQDGDSDGEDAGDAADRDGDGSVSTSDKRRKGKRTG